MQKMIPALTERQRYWLEHIQACEASGKSMAEYAALQDIAVRAMHAGKKILIKKGILPGIHPTRFQRVQVMEAVVNNQWRIGVDIPRATLANWMIRSGTLIQPLINLNGLRLQRSIFRHIEWWALALPTLWTIEVSV